MALKKTATSRTRKLAIYGSGSLAVFLAFLMALANYGVNVEINETEVIQCAGNSQEICEGYFNISLSEWHLDLKKAQIYLNDTDGVNYSIYKANKKFRADNPARWEPFNFTTQGLLKNNTKHEFKIVVSKPMDKTVKWGLKTGLINDADPVFAGYSSSDIYSLGKISVYPDGAEARVRVMNPTSFEIPFNSSLFGKYVHIYTDKTDVKTEIFEEVNRTISRNVTFDAPSTKTLILNGTPTVVTTYITEWKWVNSTEPVLAPIASKALPSKTSMIIVFKASWPATLEQRNVYWTLNYNITGSKFILDPWFNSSYLLRTNQTYNFNTTRTIMNATATNAFWPWVNDTKKLGDIGRMLTTCGDSELVNFSGTQYNWHWENYSHTTSGCNTANDTRWVYGDASGNTSATNGGNVTHYYNYSSDTVLSNSTAPSDYISIVHFSLSTGTTYNDSGRHLTSYTQTAGSFSTVTGLYGNSGRFDGSTYYSANDESRADNMLGATIFVLLRPSSAGGMHIFSKGDANPSGFRAYQEADGRTQCVFRGFTLATTTFSMSANVWQLLVCRFTPGSSVETFIWSDNGTVIRARTATTNTDISNNDNAIRIGTSHAVETPFNGLIDDFVIVNRSMTDAEVNATVAGYLQRNFTVVTLGEDENAPPGNAAPTIGDYRQTPGIYTYLFGGPGVNVSFTANDADGIAQLNQITFQHNNTASGGYINVTNSSLTIRVVNSSAWNASFIIPDLFAPAVNITAYVNDSSNAQGRSALQTITITRPDLSLNMTAFVNGSRANVSATYAESIFAITGVFNTSGAADLRTHVYRNSTNITGENNTGVRLGGGIWLFRAGCQTGIPSIANYTCDNSTVVQARIANGTVTLDAYLNDTQNADRTVRYSNPNIINVSTFINISSQNAFTLYQNGSARGTQSGQNTEITLPQSAGVFNYSIGYLGNSNYSSNWRGYNYTILNGSAEMNIYLNDTANGNRSITYGFPNVINVTAAINITEQNAFTLQENGTSRGSQVGPNITYVIRQAAGIYNFSGVFLGGQNYSQNLTYRTAGFYTIYNGTVAIDIYFNDTANADRTSLYARPNILNASAIINISDQNTFTLYRNGTTVGTQSGQRTEHVLAANAGVYNYSVGYLGTRNYSSYWRGFNWTINQATSNLTVWINNASTNGSANLGDLIEFRGNESNDNDAGLVYSLFLNNTLITRGTPAAAYYGAGEGINSLNYSMSDNVNYTRSWNASIFIRVNATNNITVWINTTLNANHTYPLSNAPFVNATGYTNISSASSNKTSAPLALYRNGTFIAASMIMNGDFENFIANSNATAGFIPFWGCRTWTDCYIKNSTDTGSGNALAFNSSAGNSVNMTYNVSGINISNAKIRFTVFRSGGGVSGTAFLIKDGRQDNSMSIGTGLLQGYFNLTAYNASTKYYLSFRNIEEASLVYIEIDNVHIADQNNNSYIGGYVTDLVPVVGGSYEFLINGTGNSTGLAYWAFVRPVPIEITIFQDGYPSSQRFEYGRRNINLTVQLNESTAFCVNFDAMGFENDTCFAGPYGTLNFTSLKEFRAINFSDGSRSKNFTTGPVFKNATLNATRYRNITSAYINLTGYESGVNTSDGTNMVSFNDSYRNTGFPRLNGELDWNGTHLLVSSFRSGSAVNFIDIYNSGGTYLTNCTYYTGASNFAGGVASNGSHILVNGWDGSNLVFMLLSSGCASISNTTSISEQALHGQMDWNGTHWIMRSQISANRSITVWNTGLQLTGYLFTLPARYASVSEQTGLSAIRDNYIVMPISNSYTIAYFDLKGNNIFNDTLTQSQARILDLDWDGLDFNESHMFIASDTASTGAFCSVCLMKTAPAIVSDILIDIGGDNSTDIIIPGELNGTFFQHRTFTNNLASEIFLFPASGSFTRYFNVSTVFMNFSNSNITDHSYRNITLQLNGMNSNAVAVNFTDRLANTTWLNMTGTNATTSKGGWVYDDFSGNPQNVTRRWIRYDIKEENPSWPQNFVDWRFQREANRQNYTSLRVISSSFGNSGGEQKLRTADVDFKDFYNISINMSWVATHVGAGPLAVGLRSNTGVEKALWSSSGASVARTAVISFTRSGNTFSTAVYPQGTGAADWVTDTMTIDNSLNYSLYFHLKTVQHEGDKLLNITYINVSGVRGSYSLEKLWDNATVRSLQVANATGFNYASVRLDAESNVPAGTSINWYLSADNATTWETATPGRLHIFTNVGRGISWRADLFGNGTRNESNGFPIFPTVKWVQLTGSAGNATNVTVDVGADGILEWRGTDEGLTQLNSSFSPRNISLSNESVARYVFNNCKTAKTCLIPVKFSSDSAGMFNYTNITFLTSSRNINLLNANKTAIDSALINRSQVNLSISSRIIGLVEITNSSIAYPDDWNYTIRATLNDTVSFTISSNTTTLIAIFSKFLEKTLDPLGWAIFPSSANQTGVPASFQNSTHGAFNITFNATYDPATLFFRQAEAVNACLNVTFSNSSVISNGLNMSLNYQPVLFNVTRNQGFGVWTFGNFSNCGAGVYLPNITWSSVCQNCIRGAGSP